MLCLAIDFEASDKIPSTARITEIGAVLFDSSTWEVVEELSQLVWDSSYPAQSKEVLEVTGITDEMLKTYGKSLSEILPKLHELMDQADCVLAHNAQFDKTLYESELGRMSLEPRLKAWVCTLTEVPYPEKYSCKRLSHLALDHGVRVDPSKLHRAIGDVHILLELLRHGGYTLDMIMDYRAIPWVYVRANVEYNDRELAKARKYMWEKVDSMIFPKFWVKKVKENLVQKEQAEAPFRVTVIKKGNIL